MIFNFIYFWPMYYFYTYRIHIEYIFIHTLYIFKSIILLYYNIMSKNDDDVLTGIKLARQNSIITRTYKRLNTYVIKKSKLQIKYHNDLIDNLIQTGIYADIYEKINNNRENELTDNDLHILKSFNYIEPDLLDTLYK